MEETKPLKAIYKHTGETIFVTPTNNFLKCNIPTYRAMDGREINSLALQFEKEIDWEQRKWELASTIFRQRLILPDERCSLTLEGDAETAIEFAEVFIETYQYQRKKKGK